MKKRIVAMMLCLVMCVTVLAGCGSKEQADAPAEAADSEETAEEESAPAGETPAVDAYAGTELHIVTVRDTRDTSTDETYGDKTALKMAEEATGIKIKWTVLDSTTATDKLPALLASEDQPDLYLGVLDQATIASNQELFYNLAEEGLLETYAPNVLEVYESYNYLERLTWPDGSIYSLAITELTNAQSSWGFSNLIIRQDWLDQLGLEVPTTADELYDVLVAFKENDMNGNGDTTDEIPLSFASNYWQGELWLHSNAFGLHGQTWQNFMHYKMLDQETGEVIPSCATDDFRKFLEFYNKLYSEGLVDIEGFSQTGEQYDAKLANNQVGVYSKHTWDPSYETPFLYKGYEGVELVLDGFQNRAPSDTYKFGFVATADANIEALLTWWNYMSQKDVAITAAYGSDENSILEKKEDGNYQYKVVEEEVDGETVYKRMAREDWMYADVVNGYPGIDWDWIGTNPDELLVEGSRAEMTTKQVWVDLLPETQFAQTIVSEAMVSDRTFIEIELFEYIESFIAESVVYGLDDAKWNAHLEQLDAVGYYDWIQWYQDVEDGNLY